MSESPQTFTGPLTLKNMDIYFEFKWKKTCLGFEMVTFRQIGFDGLKAKLLVHQFTASHSKIDKTYF